MTTRKQGASSFVKAATTVVAPAKSRAEIEKMLERYGAVGFGYQRNIEAGEVVVQFMVPDSGAKDAAKVPVTLPVSFRRVYDAMYGRPMRTDWKHPDRPRVHDPNGYDPKKLEQAERVAWRNLVLWIDAALSAASIGVQTITEAFLAHTVVVRDDGRQQRMMDYLNDTGGALPSGARALLPAVVAD